MKTPSEQLNDCYAEIEYLESRLHHIRLKVRPNPIAILRLERELDASKRQLEQILGQEAER